MLTNLRSPIEHGEETTALLADDYVLINKPADINPEEIKEQSDSILCLGTRHVLNGLTLLFGSSVDALQFYVGLKDITDKLLGFIPMSSTVTSLLGIFYLLDSITLNVRFNVTGIHEMCLAWKNQLNSWEKLSSTDSWKTHTVSGIVLAWALLSDAIATAYYLELEETSTNRIINFMIGMMASLSNIPTEGWGMYTECRTFFSTANKLLHAAFIKIQHSTAYEQSSSTYKKNFDLLWKEFSFHLKIALLDPANEKYITQENNALIDEVVSIITSGNADDIADELIKLKFDPALAVHYANQFTQHQLFEENEASHDSLVKQLTQLIITFFKKILIVTGMAQDLIESFTTSAAFMEAVFGITSSYLKYPLLVMSLSNGIVDAMFNGINSSNAIDQLTQALSSGTLDAKQVILFLISFSTAAAIGHAEFSLIKMLFDEPNATLPYPLPPKLPELIATIQAWLIAARETTNYTYYLYPLFEKILETLSNGAKAAFTKGKEIVFNSPDENKTIAQSTHTEETDLTENWEIVHLDLSELESDDSTLSSTPSPKSPTSQYGRLFTPKYVDQRPLTDKQNTIQAQLCP